MTTGRVAPFLVVGLYGAFFAVALAVIGLVALVVAAVDAATRPLREPYAPAGRRHDA